MLGHLKSGDCGTILLAIDLVRVLGRHIVDSFPVLRGVLEYQVGFKRMMGIVTLNRRYHDFDNDEDVALSGKATAMLGD